MSDTGDKDSKQGDGAKKAEIHRDEIKEAHTSHWDVDLLDRETLEALYAANRRKRRRRRLGLWLMAAAGLLLVVVCGGLLLAGS